MSLLVPYGWNSEIRAGTEEEEGWNGRMRGERGARYELLQLSLL